MGEEIKTVEEPTTVIPEIFNVPTLPSIVGLMGHVPMRVRIVKAKLMGTATQLLLKTKWEGVLLFANKHDGVG